MFGNITGWMISAVLVVVAAVAGRFFVQAGAPTAPTGWVQKTLKPLTADIDAKAILPTPTNLTDDAGDLYRDAIQNYHDHKDQYDGIVPSADYDATQTEQLRGFNDLDKAALCPSMKLFSIRPEEVINYDTKLPVIDDLTDITRAVETQAVLAKSSKDYAIAKKYHTAVLALGQKLYAERLVHDELSLGVSLMSTASAGLLGIAEEEHDEPRAAALRAFKKKLNDEQADIVTPGLAVILSVGDQDLEIHSGDFYQAAADPNVDRFWRIEAIRKIGHLKLNAANMADQIKVPKFLNRLKGDLKTDLPIKVAIDSALNMDSYKNQTQR